MYLRSYTFAPFFWSLSRLSPWILIVAISNFIQLPNHARLFSNCLTAFVHIVLWKLSLLSTFLNHVPSLTSIFIFQHSDQFRKINKALFCVLYTHRSFIRPDTLLHTSIYLSVLPWENENHSSVDPLLYSSSYLKKLAKF